MQCLRAPARDMQRRMEVNMSYSKSTAVYSLKTYWTESFNIDPCLILIGLDIPLHIGPHS
jgi:hypothetical protein